MHKLLLPFMGISGGLVAANNCTPSSPANCNVESCKHCYCLGPAERVANAPVYPLTCNGDFVLTVAGFYWSSHQDGMEYAIDDQVQGIESPLVTPDSSHLSNLVDANYLHPQFKWDFGFKLGLGYNTTCDGWGIGVNWIRYRGKAKSHVEAEYEDNHTLLPLWSAFVSSVGGNLFATDIKTFWKVELDLVDIELGREYWISKYLTMRPHIGLRIAYIDQEYTIQHKGGYWGQITSLTGNQEAQNNQVDLENDFRGVGIRAGLDTLWHLGCGWGIYGDFATAVVYGRFDVDHDEYNRFASDPHNKVKILEISDRFRASRATIDLGLGIQWMGMFCDCAYGLTVALGWEQHLFFHQNQMWRINRRATSISAGLPNNTGENVYAQTRGTLDTSGTALKVVFAF